MNTIESLLKYLSLDEPAQESYLKPVPSTPVLVSAAQVEIITRKPRLIMALILRTKPYPADWLDNLKSGQQTALAELEALNTTMLELGVWELFSTDPLEKQSAKEYMPIWGALRTVANHCLQEFHWPAEMPKMKFELFLTEFTTPLDSWSETMLR